MTRTHTQRLHSLAYLATLARRSVATIEQVAERIGARPAMVLNESRYFDADTSDKIIAAAQQPSRQAKGEA